MFPINVTETDGVTAAVMTSSSPIETWTQLAPLDDDIVNSSADALSPSILIDSPLFGFNAWYQKVHGYLSLAVCTFGIISNAMNIAVLTRRSMISPTNYLLTALASADIAVMIFYVPYAAYFYCVAKPDPDYGHSRQWIAYLLFNTNFNITAHTTTMWLTVSLAVFRYIAVCHPLIATRWCNLRRARMTVAAVVLATVVFCIPNYMMLQAVTHVSGGYWFQDNEFMTAIVKSLYYWLFGVALKVCRRPFGEFLSLRRHSQ
jgi:thyrotropin-releasing hormone receptor